MKSKKANVGGQAVIEGVMIKGKTYYTVAVRKKKSIIIKAEKLQNHKQKIFSMPLARGFLNLIEMLIIGTKSIIWSAEQATGEKAKGKDGFGITLFISIVFAALFFIALPYFLTNLVGLKEESTPFFFNLVDGIIRLAIFIGYILLISRMKDIRRLFQYHGAEHMSIHCYEKGLKLNLGNVKKFPTIHARCGTSFLFLVFVISIFIFSILPSLLIFYNPEFAQINVFARKSVLIGLRILVIPLISGVSYELLKLSDKKEDSLFFKIVSYPGKAFQKITTQKPNERQIEVAIASLKKLLSLEKYETKNNA